MSSNFFDELRHNWKIILVTAITSLCLAFIFLFAILSMQNSTVFHSDASYKSGYEYDTVASYGESESYSLARSSASLEPASSIIIKSNSLSIETKRGEYYVKELELRSIVNANSGQIISSSVRLSNNYNDRGYYNGEYDIKISKANHQMLLSQLKEIGTVTYASSSFDDVTEGYLRAVDELEFYKEELAYYQNRLNVISRGTDYSAEIRFLDKISNIKRRIRNIENSIDYKEKQGEQVNVRVRLYEKQSALANIEVVGFDEIWKSVIQSWNAFITIFIYLFPWVIAGAILYLIKRVVFR